MPVTPQGSETEDEFIGRCMGEEKSSFPDNAQRYAVCKSKWDTQNMSVDLQEENEIDALPEPKEGEEREKYIMRCIPEIYHKGGEYDQRVAISMCSSKYENSGVQLKSDKPLSLEAKIANKINAFSKYKGINLAEDAGLEGACWDGYEAIGTKMLDGREVPNCVPIKE
jgi:hypothetical protein